MHGTTFPDMLLVGPTFNGGTSAADTGGLQLMISNDSAAVDASCTAFARMGCLGVALSTAVTTGDEFTVRGGAGEQGT